MITKFAVSFAALALTIATAGTTHRLNLYEPALVGGQELKAGAYKIEIDENRAVIKGGKQTVEAAVKVETGAEKYRSTTVRYDNSNGKMKVQEIRLGGTNTKVIFADQAAQLR
jgi:hypothetical protein